MKEQTVFRLECLHLSCAEEIRPFEGESTFNFEMKIAQNPEFRPSFKKYSGMGIPYIELLNFVGRLGHQIPHNERIEIYNVFPPPRSSKYRNQSRFKMFSLRFQRKKSILLLNS